ncbi:MAG: STAS domain-containing protein [bacterium]|nr:STAS domain-containing protein [Candidatus Sumerlaeota bacterium]
MEIVKEAKGEIVILRLTGRLDATWADHLSTELSGLIRAGRHHIRLHMSGINYISSAGIRILVMHYKELHRISGSFAIVEPSVNVRSILDLSSLGLLIKDPAAPPSPESIAAMAQPEPQLAFPTSALPTVGFEGLAIYKADAGARMKCRLIGAPDRIAFGDYKPDDARLLRLPPDTLAVGIGAFGTEFGECDARFGEFLATGGAAVTQPADNSSKPDYLIVSGMFIPEALMLYGIVCEGKFSHEAKFESQEDRHELPLSHLAASCLKITGADTAVMVVIGETAGLVGARLTHPPVRAFDDNRGTLFDYPQVRNRLSFTPERAYESNLALVAGIVTSGGNADAELFVRPLGAGEWPRGHFHAAVFSYRALPKGRVVLRDIITDIFETQNIHAVLHLLNDDREIVGAGESEFTRGTIWMAPVDAIIREGQR